MKERPILFSAPMVRAILDGKKWMTRRVVKPQPARQVYQIDHTEYFAPGEYSDPDVPDYDAEVRCPYGRPGDRLWVRETWRCADYGRRHQAQGMVHYRADAESMGAWRPSIFMPRWASRLTLEVTGVRVERIQNISLDDMRAEGVRPNNEASLLWRETLTENFRTLWDDINAKRGYSWQANPWVWVIEFKRVV
jgi:hypothetical protein